MVYIYTVLSALTLVVLNGFCGIFSREWSWWAVPLIFLGIILGLIIIQLLIFVGLIFVTDINKERKKGSPVFRFFVKISLPIIIATARVKINAEGTEKMPEDRPVMLVCNHQHDFDPVIMYYLFPNKKLAFIGKKDIYTEMPFVAKAMHRLDCLPIDRENDRAAAVTIVKAIKYAKEGRASIAVFPEGYTSKTDELLPFRNGCFKIATKARVPIAVCTINNTKQIEKNILKRKTVVEFRLLDVICPEQFEDMNTTEIGDKIHNMMQESLAKLKMQQ